MAKTFQKYGVALLLILAIPVLIAFFKPGFFPTHDYIYVARIEQLDTALKSGHFPVRWSPDFRYGEALFNFYAPLPYYVGSAVHTLGFTFLTTTKILLGASLILSAFTMYLFGKEIFGKLGGIVSAVFYLYAPYRSVDVYVRGALSESWAFVFLPLIFLFAYKIYKENKVKNIVLLGASLAGLFYTHNIMTMMIAPFFILWIVSLLMLSKETKKIKLYLIAIILGMGLGASYLLPAYFEKKFVQTQFLTLGYFDFRAHFVTIKQLLAPVWGYGASTWGQEDRISLQIGLVNLIVILIGSVSLLFFKKLPNFFKVVLPVFLISFAVSVFMQHNKSAFIWEAINQLEFIQFPWRFMGISIFFASLVAGAITPIIKNQKFSKLAGVLLILAAIIFNVNYFKPESYYLDSVDEHYVSKENILYRNDKVPKDYLPIWVKKLVDDRIEFPTITSGQGEITNYQKGVVVTKLRANMEEAGSIDVPVYYFPGWEVKVNNEVNPFNEPGDLGFIRVGVSAGINDIVLRFKDTPLRKISNFLTIVSLLSVIFLLKKKSHV